MPSPVSTLVARCLAAIDMHATAADDARAVAFTRLQEASPLWLQILPVGGCIVRTLHVIRNPETGACAMVAEPMEKRPGLPIGISITAALNEEGYILECDGYKIERVEELKLLVWLFGLMKFPGAMTGRSSAKKQNRGAPPSDATRVQLRKDREAIHDE